MKKYLFLLIILQLDYRINAQEVNQNEIFLWDLNYKAELDRNFSGGIKKGNTYMGLLTVGLSLKTDKIWKNGEFRIEVMNTHGRGLSENYIGDLQFVSGIENGNKVHTFLEKLYYTHHISKGWLSIGLQDLNQEFLVSEFGSALTNSSFGIPSSFPLNFAAPIYPKTALTLTGQVNISENFISRLGVFDGDGGHLDEDKFNTKWKLSEEEGILNIAEFELKSEIIGTFKLGGMYHTGSFIDLDDSARNLSDNVGIYAILDKRIKETGDQKLGFFAQIAYHPSKSSFNPLYLGTGINYSGLFNRSDDCLAIGCAYARFHDNSYECDLECNYQLMLSSHITIQPSFHYILNPGGNVSGLDNAFAGFLRITLTK